MLILSFKDNVSFSITGACVSFQWEQMGRPASLELKKLTPGVRAAIQQLAKGGATEETLTNIISQEDGVLALAGWYRVLKKLEARFLLRRTVFAEDTPLYTLIPASIYYNFQAFEITAGQEYILSRFAYWRRMQDQLILSSPCGYAHIVVHDAGAPLLNRLATPHSRQTLLEHFPSLTTTSAENTLLILLNAGVLSSVDDAGTITEDEDQALQQWAFHDLLFHARSRFGRSLGGYGLTYPFKEVTPPPPLKKQTGKSVVSFHPPDLTEVAANDLSLTAAIENRKSIREYGKTPLTQRQLSEFLFRTARVKAVEEATENEADAYLTSKRPYPSGGATYSLELYVTVDRCTNVPTGFYHYDPQQHTLQLIAERNKIVEKLLALGKPYPHLPHYPQVLITIAARFPRVSWKYEAIAYSLIIKECGILSQNMYLVATAMNLAPCMIGAGDADLFAQLAGTDYYAETCVGEFALGTLPNEKASD